MSIRPYRLQVQSVLYGNSLPHVARSVHALARAIGLAKAQGILSTAHLRMGDCSTTPVFTGESLETLRSNNISLDSIESQFFNGNLGSAAGQNRLLDDLDGDFVLILNPDTVVAPDCIIQLFAPFVEQQAVGLVEARQLPFEHPKQYDSSTGETSWASTACALVPASVIAEVGGFDSDTFFLYCDDVDWSWRIRLAGYRIILRDSARIFHDKRLNKDGSWVVSSAEEFYSAEAALLMAHKWGRPDLVKRIEADLSDGGSETQRKGLASFQERRKSGRLPEPIPDASRVATFVRGAYAPHRY